MAIEVRQIVIKSLVTGNNRDENKLISPRDTEKLKDEILSECRHLVADLLRTERER